MDVQLTSCRTVWTSLIDHSEHGLEHSWTCSSRPAGQFGRLKHCLIDHLEHGSTLQRHAAIIIAEDRISGTLQIQLKLEEEVTCCMS